MPDEKEAKLKRFAFQVVQQLPENRKDAVRVLEYARELVQWESDENPKTAA